MSNRAASSEKLLAKFIAHAEREGIVLATESLVARLVANRESADSWQQLAVGMIKSGLASAAAEFLSLAIKRFPHHPDLRYWRGNALRLSSRHADAERDFRHVLSNTPRHRGAALSLAFLLREKGRLSAATDIIIAAWHARDPDLAETIEDL